VLQEASHRRAFEDIGVVVEGPGETVLHLHQPEVDVDRGHRREDVRHGQLERAELSLPVACLLHREEHADRRRLLGQVVEGQFLVAEGIEGRGPDALHEVGEALRGVDAVA
jgi:hypothetical protein